VVAALLIAATPVTLAPAIVPFSDVPAAAFWAIAWVMITRPGMGAAIAAGCATALAVMIRTHLAPLAAVLAAALLFSRTDARRDSSVSLLGLCASIGPVMVWWSQAVLYGHPFQSEYEATVDYFFSVDRIPANAVLYPRLLVALHSWLIVGAVVTVPLAIRHARRDAARYEGAVVALTAVGLIAVNYPLHLAYLTYEGWYWLRFLLPALLAIFVLFAAAVDQMRLWLVRRHPRAGVIAIIPVLVVALTPQRELRPRGMYGPTCRRRRGCSSRRSRRRIATISAVPAHQRRWTNESPTRGCGGISVTAHMNVVTTKPRLEYFVRSMARTRRRCAAGRRASVFRAMMMPCASATVLKSACATRRGSTRRRRSWMSLVMPSGCRSTCARDCKTARTPLRRRVFSQPFADCRRRNNGWGTVNPRAARPLPALKTPATLG
jgi:hypothetical protein